MIIIVDNYYFRDYDLFNLFNFSRGHKNDMIIYSIYPKIYKREIKYKNYIDIFKILQSIPRYYGKETNTNERIKLILSNTETKDNKIYSNVDYPNINNYIYEKLNLYGNSGILSLCDNCYDVMMKFISYELEYDLGNYFHKKYYLDIDKLKLKIKNFYPISDHEKYLIKIINSEIDFLQKKIVSVKNNYIIENTKKELNIDIKKIDVQDLKKKLENNYYYELILDAFYIPMTQSYFYEELEDGYPIGINMMITRVNKFTGLECFPNNLGSLREIYDHCNQDIIDIGYDSFTNDAIYGRYNIIIPIYICKEHHIVSKKFYEWVFDKLGYDHDHIFSLLFDMTYLLIDYFVKNEFNKKCIEKIKLYFMFWVTCKKINKRKYPKLNKNNLPIIFGMMIANNFCFYEKFMNKIVKMRLKIKNRENMLFYMNILKKLFDKMNMNNFVSELCRNYTIIDDNLSENILVILKEEFHIKRFKN